MFTIKELHPAIIYFILLNSLFLAILDDCSILFSQPLRTKSAMPPNPPTITAEIVGMEERVQLEEALHHMVARRDRLCREMNLLRGMVVIKHLADRDEEVSRLSQMVGKLDAKIKSALKEIRKYTGKQVKRNLWTLYILFNVLQIFIASSFQFLHIFRTGESDFAMEFSWSRRRCNC